MGWMHMIIAPIFHS